MECDLQHWSWCYVILADADVLPRFDERLRETGSTAPTAHVNASVPLTALTWPVKMPLLHLESRDSMRLS
jgi:hypothetical protein